MQYMEHKQKVTPPAIAKSIVAIDIPAIAPLPRPPSSPSSSETAI